MISDNLEVWRWPAFSAQLIGRGRSRLHVQTAARAEPCITGQDLDFSYELACSVRAEQKPDGALIADERELAMRYEFDATVHTSGGETCVSGTTRRVTRPLRIDISARRQPLWAGLIAGGWSIRRADI